jgi:hypothetical protein
MQPLIWGYKFTREIARRMPHFRGEPGVLHPGFAAGGPASVIEHAEGPVPFNAPRIVYSEEDDRALEAFAREKGACLPFSVPLTIFAHSSFFHSFLVLGGGVVVTAWHSVSSPLSYAVRDVAKSLCLCILRFCTVTLARHVRNEAARAGRRRRCEAECVRCAQAQSCRPVNRAGECKREHLWDRSCHRREGCHDHRGGARHQDVV